MIGRFLAAHRSLAATIGSTTALAIALGTTALVSDGYTAQRMQLDDGAVWVVNDAAQAVGRANPAVAELNSVVAAEGNDLEVVQSGPTVLLVDRSNASLDVIDPATSEAGETVALPPERPEVWIAGPNAVILAQGTGEVWIVPLTELQGFDPTTRSTYSFGANTVAAVDDAGTLYAYGASSSQVYRVDAAQAGSDAERFSVGFADAAKDSFAITAVGGRWAVLDRTARRLAVEGRAVDLSGELAKGTSPVLQLPSASGSGVLVAGTDRLLSVPLDGGSPQRLETGRSGTPAPPVVRARCTWAAWSGDGLWKRCGDGVGARAELESLDASARLTFVGGATSLVLNDARSGDSWAVDRGGDLIDNWQELLKKDKDKQVQDNDEDRPPQTEQQQQPPVAVDDDFGARPGRATTLPVLLNDYDPNGDVLVITAVEPIPATSGRIDLIGSRQQLLITLPERAAGTIAFRYTIDDGRGGSASALVSVTVRQPYENGPPVQVRTSKTTVTTGGQVTTQVLGDWIDPDGDAMYLVGAGVAAPDQVSSKPDGVVLYTDAGRGGDLKSVALEVSDGTASGTGSLAVTVRPPSQVPIIADPFPVTAYAGQPITVSPLDHVRGGNGTVRLNAVPATTGVTIVPSFDKGTFTFSSDQVRTHYLEYVVTDGTQTATGLIRIDVSAPPSTDSRPVTIPKTVFVRSGSSASVDVAGTDIDPAGGVLLVSSLAEPGGGLIRAEILEQRLVRVTLLGPLAGPVTFGYTVTNGTAQAQGTITAIEVPLPGLPQPPIARDDSVSVRAGDTIDIPVLDNDEQPDGLDVTLDPELAEPLPPGGGLLFASGDRLRYLAPRAAGDYSAVYRITSARQTAQATLRISVREPDQTTNNPPVPTPVTARVTAGDTVRIPIPLTGIDPDGDSVQLIGQASPPEKGTVEDVGDDWFDYQAGPYSSGTDTFTYSVIDRLGARATGTVRVGIAPRTSSARNPIAVNDEVTVRPNRSVTVQVLQNDSDPEGGALTVSGVSVSDGSAGTKAAVLQGRFVRVTPPAESGKRDYSVTYTVVNATGGESSAFVTVRVDPAAPPARPVVTDSVVTVTDVLGRSSIDVPVLDNVFFADGPVSVLGVSVLEGWTGGATVLPNKRIRVNVERRGQIIPFAVSNPDNPKIRGYGFIRVPGLDDALPQLNTKAPPITVRSEQPVTIDLADYVVAIGGGRIRLTGTAGVSATHASGADLVVDDDTLTFTSAPQYFGPASITFEVTDSDPSDPTARRATLSLPIKVLPRANQPPVFLGAQLEVQPDQTREIDLVKLTDYPYAGDLEELQYSVAGPAPAGFSYQLNGQRLVIGADAATPVGTTGSLTLTVRDQANPGKAGVIELHVVPSTRPLAAPLADAAIAPRGQTTTIDVLANDAAGNPFPDTPLRVVRVAGIDQGSLPTGITASPSADRSRIAVSVASDAPPTDVNIQYQVADKTGDPTRYVWAALRVSVQDRPDPVSGVSVTEFGDRTLRLAWQPGPSNNAPITRYEVTGVSAADGRVVATASCTGSASCILQTPGNGPSNALRISVAAVNSVGSSDPTSLGSSIWSDIIPPAPTALGSTPLDQGLRVTWSKPDDGGKGSPITYYLVTVGGTSVTVPVDPADPPGTPYSRRVPSGSPNGSATSYSVSARNSAPNSLARWNSASATGTPAGAPVLTGTPQASVTSPTTASLSWDGVFAPNGSAIATYYAAAYTGQAPTCVVSGVEDGSPSLRVTSPSGAIVQAVGGTRYSFDGLSTNQPYSLVVFAYNGQGCTASATARVIPRRAPSTVTGAATEFQQTATSTWDYVLRSFTVGGASDADTVIYRLVGEGVDGTAYGPISPGTPLSTTNGSQYGRQVAVQLKACKKYPELAAPLCSADWSAAIEVGVPVRLDLAGLGQRDVENPGLGVTPEWFWSSSTAGPSFPDYAAARVSCDGGATWAALDGGPGLCDGPSRVVSVGGPDLLVEVSTRAGELVRRTFTW